MDFDNIKPGTYKLFHDVKNPEADRRSKDWTKVPVWERGMRLVVRPARGDSYDIEKPGSLGYIPCYRHNEQAQALLVNLVPDIETVSSVLTELGNNPTFYAGQVWLLNQLIKDGKITMADIREAVENYDSEDE